MAKWFFGGQARKKEAKFELFGLQEANLPSLLSHGAIFLANWNAIQDLLLRDAN